jgi:hypothetical protein
LPTHKVKALYGAMNNCHSSDMFRILAFLQVVFPLACAAETPFWWEKGQVYLGEGVQSDGPRWSMELTVLSEDLARISYPSIPCAGMLRVISSGKGEVLAEEMITENQRACITGGLVSLWSDKGGVLRFDWSHGGFGITARGTLSQPGS